jgi:MYXO-CTERM domain-containing protein/uncharacterized repeat protein (TIGR01451 family)
MTLRRLPLLLAFACTALLPASAAAQQLRFTATAPGNVAATGNTLGLSKALSENGPGIEDSIGTFLSLGNTVDNDPANPGNPWPMGTTNDWTMNGSLAVLDLPSEVEILYAELLWGGSHTYGDENVMAALDTAITLATGNASTQVTPDPMTSLTISEVAGQGFAVNYYMRSADVTAFVKQAGDGAYEVTGVPGTQATATNSLNAAGWTLVVAYRDESAPTRNLSIFVGGSFVDENDVQDYQVSGFCAPPAGVVDGTAIVSTIEGDADLGGDQLLISPTVAGPFVNLSGPNNPQNNFFCSQINDSTGSLDTQGTAGMVNHDPVGEVNVVGGRQGWDVTTVPLSSQNNQLQNSQTSAVLRTTTTGDSFVPILAALALDVNAPQFAGSAASTVDAPDQVILGDKFTFTATLENGGEVTAQTMVFSMPVDDGLSLVSFATDGMAGDINGMTVDAVGLAAGVDVGQLPSGQTKKIEVGFEVVAPPKGMSYFLKAKWAYGFEVCVNQALIPESFSQSALVKFDPQTSSSSATSSTGASMSGSSTSGSGVGGGDPSGAGGSGSTGSATGGVGTNPGGEGGCACSTPGGESAGGYAAAALGLLGLAVVHHRQRRREGERRRSR